MRRRNSDDDDDVNDDANNGEQKDELRSGGCSFVSEESAAATAAFEQKKTTKSFFGVANENKKGVCVGCREINAPCISQGWCLDPTVIELFEDEGGNVFLIEGQLVRAVDEEWRATSLAYKMKTSTKEDNELFVDRQLSREQRHLPACQS